MKVGDDVVKTVATSFVNVKNILMNMVCVPETSIQLIKQTEKRIK
jgi:hypothetical protein